MSAGLERTLALVQESTPTLKAARVFSRDVPAITRTPDTASGGEAMDLGKVRKSWYIHAYCTYPAQGTRPRTLLLPAARMPCLQIKSPFYWQIMEYLQLVVVFEPLVLDASIYNMLV